MKANEDLFDKIAKHEIMKDGTAHFFHWDAGLQATKDGRWEVHYSFIFQIRNGRYNQKCTSKLQPIGLVFSNVFGMMVIKAQHQPTSGAERTSKLPL